jgi:hypothetical protein
VFLYPPPELPDDTPIDHVRFAVRIRKVLNAAGIKTVGEFAKPRTKRCSAYRILDRALSHIFAKRWAATA